MKKNITIKTKRKTIQNYQMEFRQINIIVQRMFRSMTQRMFLGMSVLVVLRVRSTEWRRLPRVREHPWLSMWGKYSEG